MDIIAYDSETAPISEGDYYPLITCGSFYHSGGGSLVHHTALYPILRSMLRRACVGELLIVCHNAPFDMGVVIRNYPDLFPLVVQAFDANAIACTEARARLIDIADGKYTDETCFAKYVLSGRREVITYRLDALCRRYLGWSIPGKGLVTNTYGKLRDVPCEQWSELERLYPVYDAQAAYMLYGEQNKRQMFLDDAFRVGRGAMWVGAMTSRGICTDETKVKAFETLKTAQMWDKVKALQDPRLPPAQQGLISVIRKKGTEHEWTPKKNTKKVRALLVDLWDESTLGPIPMTKGGKKTAPQASLDADSLDKSNIPILQTYGELAKLQRKVSTVIPALMRGIHTPIHSRFTWLLNTGRFSSKNPNIQNTDREPGMRECFVPSRPDYCFVQCDWSGNELCAWAQICYVLFGYSRMREAINAGLDCHLKVAGELLSIPYDQLDRGNPLHENARTLSKIANFGFMGGMVARTFIEYAYGYGVILTIQQAQQILLAWQRAWPEHVPYFRYIKAELKTGHTVQMYSNRYRGGCSFTQASNTKFQGLASEAMREAGWEMFKLAHLVPSSPLYDYHNVNVIHDEFIAEGPIARAAEAAEEMSRVMVAIGSKWMPDLRITADPCLMNCWSKKAKSIRDANGRLMVWEYKVAA